jgi:TRAP-type mannitol/chloroaromatic compound transport system substrate-binding protein
VLIPLTDFNPSPHRRKFLSRTLLAGAGAATFAGCSSSNTEEAAIQWTLRTSWTKDFPGLFDAAGRLAKRINDCCAGHLKISVVGAETSDQAFSVFDAVSAGSAQMGHSCALFWQGKSIAAPFFAGLPFGMTSSEITSWLLAGEGLALWRELYAHFSLIPFPVGNLGAQMAGWSRKEIRSLRQVRALKMRMTGLSAEVWRRTGGQIVDLEGSKIVAALKAGELDSAEWMGPWHDQELGLHLAAKHYYYPGWQEPGSTLECFINKPAFDALSPQLQAAIESACLASHVEESALMQARNQQALLNLVSAHQVNVRRLPADILSALLQASDALRAEIVERDSFAKKVFDSSMRFREQARQWQNVAELAFVSARG